MKIRILSAVCLFATLLAAPAGAVTPTEANAAFAALNRVYWDAKSKSFRKEETGDTKADFWFAAQLWDVVMDQYARTRSAAVKRQIHDLYDGFLAQHPDWTKNKYNDDIMWWTIACTRAYQLTKNERYLKKAKASFDFVYQNFCDDTLGGGIWWTSERRSKNSCIESPAVIAAVRLADLLKDDAYLAKAKSLYQWQKTTLTDGQGKVFDSIRYVVPRTNQNAMATNAPAAGNPGRRRSPVATFSLTYNQGTYIGASVLLYLKTKDRAYLDEARKTADWTRANLCTGTNQILRSENQGDGGAFKGILVRYMKLLIEEGGCREYLPWMQANAQMAWRNRRPADNIMGPDWTKPTSERIQSQTACSAVAVVVEFAEERK